MARKIRRRSEKAGLPPGSLVHIGERVATEVKIRIIDYDEAHFEERQVSEVRECFPYKDKPTVTWIDVEGIYRVDVLEQLGECFKLHPLTMEDILNTEQRPKMEDYIDYLYIVLKMLGYDQAGRPLKTEQVSIVLGHNFVISFQEGIAGDTFNHIRERLRTGAGRTRGMKADYLAYTLMDSIVDNYFVILENLGEDLEFLEDEVVTNPERTTLHSIHSARREMVYLRKSIWPLREVINIMARGESKLVGTSTELYLRDIYDHTVQVIDTVETYRDMLSGMLDIYLSSASNRLNEVVKVLTIISTIFIPLTFIAGVYGMNFDYMPELRSPWGYPAVWLVMLIIAVGMLIYFRRRKWL